ncbi:MAG: hypothetical protein ACREU2_04050 [Steroidobacteraceae bacterium]
MARSTFPETLIPLVILNILEGKPLPIYGDGLNVRLAARGRSLPGDRGGARFGPAGRGVHIAGGATECPNVALVERLCGIADEAFRSEPDLCRRYPHCPSSRGQLSATLNTFVQDSPGHAAAPAPMTPKSAELGFRPAVPLPSGLRDALRWYLDNEAWWHELRQARRRSGLLPVPVASGP